MQNLFEEIKVPQEELENMVNEKLDMIRKDSRKMKRTKFFCEIGRASCSLHNRPGCILCFQSRTGGTASADRAFVQTGGG